MGPTYGRSQHGEHIDDGLASEATPNSQIDDRQHEKVADNEKDILTDLQVVVHWIKFEATKATEKRRVRWLGTVGR